MRKVFCALIALVLLAACAPTTRPELKPITTEVAFTLKPDKDASTYVWTSTALPFAELEVVISGEGLAQNTDGCTGAGERVVCILDGPFRTFTLPLAGEVGLWTLTAVFAGSDDSYFLIGE